MNDHRRRFLIAALLATIPTVVSRADDAPPPRIPVLFLIGDSTVKNSTGKGDGGLWGWGDRLAEHFDKSKITIQNRARGGRSSRTYLTEGLWDQVLAEIKPGDFVLMQFGHNDGGSINTGTRPRASLKGSGDEAQEVVMEATQKKEVVHTYGWYLRKFIADTKAKGATPIVLSPIPRNIWKNDHVVRADRDYGKWASEAAAAEMVAFIDLNAIVATKYEAIGQEKVAADFFTQADHTHTTAAGATVNARCVVEVIRGLKDIPLRAALTEIAPPKDQN